MTKTKEDFYHPKGYSPKIGDMVVCEDEYDSEFNDIGLVTKISITKYGEKYFYFGKLDNLTLNMIASNEYNRIAYKV